LKYHTDKLPVKKPVYFEENEDYDEDSAEAKTLESRNFETAQVSATDIL
jgi:hypothetical protein